VWWRVWCGVCVGCVWCVCVCGVSLTFSACKNRITPPHHTHTTPRLADYEDLQHSVVDWLNSQAAVWYEEGISKLVSQYDNCLNVQGDYVEK
jgi:hypothetical protein